jgi:hypothetical protein
MFVHIEHYGVCFTQRKMGTVFYSLTKYSCDKLKKPSLGGSSACVGNLSPELLREINFQLLPLYSLAETSPLPILKKAGKSQNVTVQKNISVSAWNGIMIVHLVAVNE